MYNEFDQSDNAEYYQVIDDNGNDVSPLDDDYHYWKQMCHDMYENPLSDDYIREEYR